MPPEAETLTTSASKPDIGDGRFIYRHLDAAQLVKHAYGLRTQAVKRARGCSIYTPPPRHGPAASPWTRRPSAATPRKSATSPQG